MHEHQKAFVEQVKESILQQNSVAYVDLVKPACALLEQQTFLQSTSCMMRCATEQLFRGITMLQVDLQKTWVMFSSIVLAFAFVFGNSVRSIYESLIYLFVVHPFDVGDKIIVDSVSSKVSPKTVTITRLPVF